MNKKYDLNSSKNQTIKGQFVGREVLACISDMVEYILRQDDYDNAPFTIDDIENYYINNSDEIEELEEQIEELEEQIEELEEEEGSEEQIEELEEQIEELEEQILELEQEQEEPQEIYEYWIVSPWLGKKLRDKGEPVLERWGGWIWGRTCTGQAILLDGVISSICYDMRILEGQPHEWK